VHPGSGQSKSRKRVKESAPAKQPAVARLHQSKPTSDQSDGRVAKRRCLPQLELESAGAKEHVGDLTVGRIGEMTVKGAQHEHEAVMPLSSKRKRCWAGVDGWMHNPRP
jgi:hypothetical protein